MTLTAATATAPKKRRRTQQERTAQARAKLLDAAVQLIADKGLANTTMAEIAMRADFTRGAIQHHFESRDELVLSILSEAEKNITESFADSLVQLDAPLSDRIDTLIDHLAEVSFSNFYLAMIDIWLYARSDPNLRDSVRDSIRRSSASYRSYWQQAFGAEVPANVIAESRRVVVMIFRGLALSRVFARDARSMKGIAQSTKALVRQHMLSHIKARPAKKVAAR